MKIKKNDLVKILAGKDNGKTGKILQVFSKEGKVTVENLNLVKKNRRPRREGEKGQIVELPRKVSISNVMLVCPKCGNPSRVGYKMTDDVKMRICKKCKAEI